ncbi:hypothetical protein Syun_004847 [Stephania yunnanensis]|uniref:Uncharacterized protein n=1 Tax=Stephania yunnanensis TaxID=152371 RepID=A0AAP0Q1T2_9MAGN
MSPSTTTGNLSLSSLSVIYGGGLLPYLPVKSGRKKRGGWPGEKGRVEGLSTPCQREGKENEDDRQRQWMTMALLMAGDHISIGGRGRDDGGGHVSGSGGGLNKRL